MLRAARRGLLILAGAAAAVLAVELVLRLAWPQDVAGSWLQDSGRGYDINRPLATALHIIGPRRVTYRIDARGFRGAPDHDAPRRVLVLGDSLTFGWLIDEPQTYIARLEAALNREAGPPRVALLNAAVGAWSNAHALAYLEDRGDEIRPDAVLLVLSGDETIRAVESTLWQRIGDGVQRLPPARPADVRGARALSEFRVYRWLADRSHVANLLKRAVAGAVADAGNSAVAALPPTPPADGVALQRALLQRLAAWCRSRKVALWVVSTGLIGLQHGNGSAPVNDAFLREAGAIFDGLGVPYLDLRAALDARFTNRGRYFIPVDGHPNEAAAAVIADEMWPWLQRQLAAIDPAATGRGPG